MTPQTGDQGSSRLRIEPASVDGYVAGALRRRGREHLPHEQPDHVDRAVGRPLRRREVARARRAAAQERVALLPVQRSRAHATT
eukprot:6197720-Pleurochrysis_carterae.AAC.1